MHTKLPISAAPIMLDVNQIYQENLENYGLKNISVQYCNFIDIGIKMPYAYCNAEKRQQENMKDYLIIRVTKFLQEYLN